MAQDDTIPVIEEATVIDAAYSDGFERFRDADQPAASDVVEAVDLYKDGATFINHVAPDLRALAGYDDRGYGTYQKDREVAVIPVGDAADEPAEAVKVDARHVYRTLVRAFDLGAYDALEGDARGASDDVRIL